MKSQHWQPIETAPKDRPILLFLRGYPPTVSRWVPVWWEESLGRWASAECDPGKYLPSHWMDPGSPEEAS